MVNDFTRLQQAYLPAHCLVEAPKTCAFGHARSLEIAPLDAQALGQFRLCRLCADAQPWAR